MSRKTYLLLLSFFITVNSANAGVADQNARLKLLIERAKARKAGQVSPSTTTTTTTTTSTPEQTVIINHSPTPPLVQTPAIPAPIKEVAAPIPPTFERKPRIIETHPKLPVEAIPVAVPQTPSIPVVEERVIIKERSVREQPVRVRETTSLPTTTTTTIEKKTTVVQPPVQTLITPSFSSIQTKSTTQTSLSPAKPNSKLIIQEETVTQPNIQTNTEFKTEPSAGNSSYDDVLKSIDEILKGQKVEEQAGQKPRTKPIELNDKPVPKSDLKNEVTNKDDKNLINEGTKFAPKDAAAKPATTTTPGAETVNGTSASDKDADYLLVLRKSLKSLEEDSWANVKLNMGESLDYFAKEKKLYPNNPKLNTYYKIILGFQRFSEGGLELDEGDFADFEDAEALYLDTQDLLEEAQKELGKDYNAEQMKGIVGTVLKYTDEELQYIEEVLGM